MLKLLRKYQKSIFAIVAVMVIGSFSFFGTYGALQSEKRQEEDVVIGKVLDGSRLSSKDVQQLSRFLDSDFQDAMNGNGGANLLNDGFLRNDIFKCGLGTLFFGRMVAFTRDFLCSSYLENIKSRFLQLLRLW